MPGNNKAHPLHNQALHIRCCIDRLQEGYRLHSHKVDCKSLHISKNNNCYRTAVGSHYFKYRILTWIIISDVNPSNCGALLNTKRNVQCNKKVFIILRCYIIKNGDGDAFIATASYAPRHSSGNVVHST